MDDLTATAVCKHGETGPHHFTADDYPVPGLWRCDGPETTVEPCCNPLTPDCFCTCGCGERWLEASEPSQPNPT